MVETFGVPRQPDSHDLGQPLFRESRTIHVRRRHALDRYPVFGRADISRSSRVHVAICEHAVLCYTLLHGSFQGGRQARHERRRYKFSMRSRGRPQSHMTLPSILFGIEAGAVGDGGREAKMAWKRIHTSKAANASMAGRPIHFQYVARSLRQSSDLHVSSNVRIWNK